MRSVGFHWSLIKEKKRLYNACVSWYAISIFRLILRLFLIIDMPFWTELSSNSIISNMANHKSNEVVNGTPTQGDVSKESGQKKGQTRKKEKIGTHTPRVLRTRSQEKPKAPESVDPSPQDQTSTEKKSYVSHFHEKLKKKHQKPYGDLEHLPTPISK